MKSWIIAGGALCALFITGVLVAVFVTPVEYHYAGAKAHIDGATPSQIEHWEMY
ncbi:MAG: hypothetical protein ACK4SL_00825 [Candidatus Paceibacteria bacterium]